jgi:hypothetical protein
MPDHRDLMRWHVEALFTHDHAGRLERVNDPGGAPAPLFFLGHTPDGPLWRARTDLRDDTVQALERAVRRLSSTDLDAPIDPSPFVEILASEMPVRRIWTGPAFVLPHVISSSTTTRRVTEANVERLRRHLHEWIPDLGACDPMTMLEVDGEAVSICASVRRTPAAHEAGVETTVSCRGHRYAAQVVASWGALVRAMGAQPLYSTSWQNEASRSVARQLSMIQVGNDLHIS